MNHQAAPAALTHATGWRKSSYSIAQNDCVEITTEVPGLVGVRDSKRGTNSPVLAFTLSHWHTTLAATKTNKFTT
ncbi:MAG: DUF397 domain-containing protein [Pseudonocardiaceae bacterium]